MDISGLNLRDVENEIVRRSMLNFALRMKPNYMVNWHHQLICERLDDFASGKIKRLMIFVPPQHGKQINHNTLIITPQGIMRHGDLKVGDYVYGRNGKPVQVIALSDESLSDYEIEFSDGQIIQCHANHEWVVYDNSAKRERILETKYIFNCVLDTDGQNRFQVDGNVLLGEKTNRSVVAVRKVDNPTMGRCIQVEGGVYLVGENAIPTHNSELSSRLFPALALGRNPDLKVVLASYSASMAESFNRDIQRYIDSPEYAELFPETKLQAAGSNGKYVRNSERFDIVDRNGFLKTVGVGGSLTGTAADLLIIDDPVKDMQDAKSAVMQQSTWDWYLSVAETRIHNGTGICIIQTRWDSSDLSGKLLDAMREGTGDTWTIVNLPAICENNDNPDDPRKVGEALWADRHSLERLRGIERKSKRVFQSLYQQNPMPVQAGGECYKEFDHNMNTGETEYDPELPLHFSFDFNVNPYMTCGVYQVKKEMVGNLPFYEVFKIEEVCLRSPRNTTKGICEYLRTKYKYRHKSTCYVYGDPNGMKEDTRTEKGHNDFYIIKQHLADFHPSFRVATKAPAVAMRISFMNAVFGLSIDGFKYIIDKKCTNTINDYLYIKEESDGTKQKLKAIDPITGINSERFGHCFVGSTIIETLYGQRRIDQIEIGNSVLTRNGYRKVINVHNNGLREVKTYQIGDKIITCTPDHRFFANNEFIPIGHLINSNTFCIFDKNKGICKQKLLITQVTGSQDTRNLQSELNGSIIQGVEKNMQIVYDLTVDGDPEYFANGILVHNCSDSDEYFICNAFPNIYVDFQRGGKGTPMRLGKRVSMYKY